MELRQLRYLVGISEAGSLLAASKTLHIAQPALSQHIATLERELGTPLFTRSHRGMTLTDAGRTFVEHARVVLQDVERAKTSVREGPGGQIGGDVVVGLPTTVALAATLPILQAARERHPAIRLKLIESHSGFLVEWLQSGRLDLSFLFAGSDRPGIAESPLLEERLVFVSHRRVSANPGALTLKAVAALPLVMPGTGHGLRRIVDEACSRSGLELNVVAEIDSLPNLKKAVETGFAGTILSPGAVAEEVSSGRLAVSPISQPVLLRRVVCATSLTRPRMPASAAIVALATDVVQRLVATKAWPARWIG